jgi:transposase
VSEDLGGVSRAGLEALVVAQAELIARLQTEVAELRAEVKELRERLGRNSRNSSLPPSSDGYRKPPATKSLRRPSGRKPGGQPGHGGHHLERVERPDEVVRHVPERCDGCGRGVAWGELVDEEVRQVFDLPAVRLRVCEHRIEHRRCACGVVSSAPIPVGVGAPAQYGPRLRALAIYLVNYQHLPYDRAARLFSDWLGASLSTGTLHTIVTQAGQGLDQFTALVLEQLLVSPVVHVDETGARTEGRLRWVHSASTDALTLYRLHDSRGHAGVKHLGLLETYEGVAVHDSWQVYRKYQAVTHALCNVHHLRELQAVIEHDGEAQTWASQMDALLRELKHTVEHAKAAGQTSLCPTALATFTDRYQTITALGRTQNPLASGPVGKRGRIPQTKTANLVTRLERHQHEALRFAHDFRVPFDNNQAERDLRMIKLQQKISGSWRTTTGAEGFLALRSYLSTAAKHRRGVLDTITRLVAGQPWLPQTAGP